MKLERISELLLSTSNVDAGFEPENINSEQVFQYILPQFNPDYPIRRSVEKSGLFALV